MNTDTDTDTDAIITEERSTSIVSDAARQYFLEMVGVSNVLRDKIKHAKTRTKKAFYGKKLTANNAMAINLLMRIEEMDRSKNADDSL